MSGLPYPADVDNVIDLGDDHFLIWDGDAGGFLWHHPACKAWASLRFLPDPRSTGHVRMSGGPGDENHLTIQGSLLCPMGCGDHGFIRDGKWVRA